MCSLPRPTSHASDKIVQYPAMVACPGGSHHPVLVSVDLIPADPSVLRCIYPFSLGFSFEIRAGDLSRYSRLLKVLIQPQITGKYVESSQQIADSG